eukprot:SAG31_NODE_3337_length_4388_cov_3.372814_6_plen_142_part_00
MLQMPSSFKINPPHFSDFYIGLYTCVDQYRWGQNVSSVSSGRSIAVFLFTKHAVVVPAAETRAWRPQFISSTKFSSTYYLLNLVLLPLLNSRSTSGPAAHPYFPSATPIPGRQPERFSIRWACHTSMGYSCMGRAAGRRGS